LLLSIALVALLIGIRFGRARNANSIRKHRYIMTVTVTLRTAGLALVMLPTFYRYYSDPDIMLLSTLSLSTLIHASVGIPATILGVLFALNIIPKRVKTWMWLTAMLWIAAIIMGIVLFIQMLQQM